MMGVTDWNTQKNGTNFKKENLLAQPCWSGINRVRHFKNKVHIWKLQISDPGNWNWVHSPKKKKKRREKTENLGYGETWFFFSYVRNFDNLIILVI